MAVEIEGVSELSATELQQVESFIRDFITDSATGIDTANGSVFDQLVVKFHAMLNLLNQTNIQRVMESNSLSVIVANPEQADDGSVDKVLSNYRIERNTGSLASGQILLRLNSLSFTPVPKSVKFTSNGVVFTPTRSFNGVTNADLVLTANERVIQTINADNDDYSLLIDVVAVESGISGNVKKGAPFTTDSSIANLVTSTAFGDFDGGEDLETNAELVGRLSQGISTKNMGSRDTIKPMLADVFPSVTDVSVIGAGDPEQLRDKHGTLGTGGFGKADIYVRTRSAPLLKTLTITATLEDKATGKWIISMDREASLAAYRVNSIKKSSSSDALKITKVTFNSDITEVAGVDFTPSMQDNEHVFTRYQTLAIEFYDTAVANLSNGDEQDYLVELLYMPEVTEINDYALSRSKRHPAGDYLVRATIPCMVSIGLVIIQGPADPDVDTDAVKLAVAAAVNSLDYQTGRLPLDKVVNAVAPLLPSRTRIKFPVDMRGEILTPLVEINPSDNDTDGSIWIFNNHELAAPNRPDIMVTSRTVNFFLDPSKITVDVLPSDHLTV